MSDSVEAVVKAWNVEGKNPEYHRLMQEKLRQNWPTLANAVEKLASGG